MRSQSVDDDAEEAGAGALSRVASLWHSFAENPKEAAATMLALGAAGAVIVNALFMQPGPHPAPIFSTRLPAAAPVDTTGTVLPRPRPPELTRTNAAAAQPEARTPARPAPTNAVASQDDPIALLLAPSKRVLAVQRALADFGYGQISPTGLEDRATAAAIRKFEREHKLPVDGQVSERVMRALATATGRSFE